jgi:hypothetical protein
LTRFASATLRLAVVWNTLLAAVINPDSSPRRAEMALKNSPVFATRPRTAAD